MLGNLTFASTVAPDMIAGMYLCRSGPRDHYTPADNQTDTPTCAPTCAPTGRPIDPEADCRQSDCYDTATTYTIQLSKATERLSRCSFFGDVLQFLKLGFPGTQ
jgi:hypothetical protein